MFNEQKIEEFVLKGISKYANFRLGKKFRKEVIPGAIFEAKSPESNSVYFQGSRGRIILSPEDYSTGEKCVKENWKDVFAAWTISVEEFLEYRDTEICNFESLMLISYPILRNEFWYAGLFEDESELLCIQNLLQLFDTHNIRKNPYYYRVSSYELNNNDSETQYLTLQVQRYGRRLGLN